MSMECYKPQSGTSFKTERDPRVAHVSGRSASGISSRHVDTVPTQEHSLTRKFAGRLQCSQSEKKTSWSKKVENYVADVHLDAREALLHAAESHEEVVSAC